MPIIDQSQKYPFPGAGSRATLPIPAGQSRPKVWGACGLVIKVPKVINDPSVDFIASNVQVGDPVYITNSSEGWRLASTVAVVIHNFVIELADEPPTDAACAVYKVGVLGPHNLSTLAQILVARGLEEYTMHWATLWTSALIEKFAGDETGDIYCIT